MDKCKYCDKMIDSYKLVCQNCGINICPDCANNLNNICPYCYGNLELF